MYCVKFYHTTLIEILSNYCFFWWVFNIEQPNHWAVYYQLWKNKRYDWKYIIVKFFLKKYAVYQLLPSISRTSNICYILSIIIIYSIELFVHMKELKKWLSLKICCCGKCYNIDQIELQTTILNEKGKLMMNI